MTQPIINIGFTTTADSTIRKGENGIVAVILEDNSNTTVSYSLTREKDIIKSHWGTKNLDYLNLIFKGSPKRVLIERVGSDSENKYDDALSRLKNKKWDYLTVPGIATEGGDIKTIADWIIAQRADSKGFKAVLPCDAVKLEANSAGIVNFPSDNIKVGTKTYTNAEYCARIAGILAGLSLDMSATYYTLPEVESFTESLDPDADADGGKLILLNDGEKIKLGRAVNSLTKCSDGMSEEVKKIKIVNGMDMMSSDIRRAFEEQYIGANNSYDNKVVFLNAVKEYFKRLVRYGVLDDTYDHTVELDIEKIRDYLGDIAADMSDDEVKRHNTGSHIFAKANVKFSDAIEDLDFAISM